MDSVRIVGLTRLESLDLRKRFPEASISFEPTRTGTQHGELASVALVALTIAGLNVLAVWLLKNRESGTIEHTIEIVGADGSRRLERFSMQTSASTSQADVVKALAPKIGIDPTLLKS